MRTAYHEKLSRLNDQLAAMCGLAATGMEQATTALLQDDIDAADHVIGSQGQLSEMGMHVEESCIALLALQQPVAGELRRIISAIRLAADLDRMGALAVHVGKIVRRRHPEPVLPTETRDLFAQMGTVAVQLGSIAKDVLRNHNPEQAARIRAQDDAMDDLHRRLFDVLTGSEWRHDAQTTVDVALLGRFYERFADHAVEVGRRVFFQETGALFPEQPVRA